MFDWLIRRRRHRDAGNGDDIDSRMHHRRDDDRAHSDFAETDAAGFAEERERVYAELFGEPEVVHHELVPLMPHIDVYTFAPGHNGRDYWTILTGGMSDLRLTLPRGADARDARVELVFYCQEPEEAFLKLLRLMAHFPHDLKSWLGYGHTLPNGQPPEPIFAASPELDTLIFLPAPMAPDDELGNRLLLDGDPVRLLWVVPISTAECELKLERGAEHLTKLMQRHQHPHVFTQGRKSYL